MNDPIRPAQLILGAELGPELTRRAQLRVAERARNAAECRELLAMLGLDQAAAQSAPTCRGCGRPMALRTAHRPEGWARQQSGSQCTRCYQHSIAAAAPSPVVVMPQQPRLRRRCPNRPRDIAFQVRVAELRAVEGRSWARIATELGCSASTARAAYAQVVTL
ncbi:hypothetical protein [Nocardia sp. CC227C]|uniref:hypothetical protein n=1 Tax=Nocardia sp. CC227C TaxID=3044562 RepID=UPI00278C8C6E|nr:hypothetical protein [Nocardia sp. CC227C]